MLGRWQQSARFHCCVLKYLQQNAVFTLVFMAQHTYRLWILHIFAQVDKLYSSYARDFSTYMHKLSACDWARCLWPILVHVGIIVGLFFYYCAVIVWNKMSSLARDWSGLCHTCDLWQLVYLFQLKYTFSSCCGRQVESDVLTSLVWIEVLSRCHRPLNVIAAWKTSPVSQWTHKTQRNLVANNWGFMCIVSLSSAAW